MIELNIPNCTINFLEFIKKKELCIMVIRKRPLGILSGFDPVLPDSLDKTKYKNTYALPEIINMLNKYQTTIQQIDNIRSKLDNHINDVNNPHKTTFDPSTFNVTYLLYKEYKEKYDYTGTFEKFLSMLYDTLDKATFEDLADPITNKDKFVTLEIIEFLINSHNNDNSAHQNIINQIHNGEIFKAHPQYFLTNKFSSNISLISDSDTYVHDYNSTFTQISTHDSISHCWNSMYQSFPLFGQRTNYVPNSEIFNNPNLHGLTIDTTNSYIPNLRNEYNYLPVKEHNDNVERYIQLTLDNIPIGWTSVSFYYYPIIRDILQISLNNNIIIKTQLSTQQEEIIANTTSKNVFLNIQKCISGYYRINITFYNNFNFNDIKVYLNDYYDDDFRYIANTEHIAGIFYQLQIENTTIASPPIITQSSPITLDPISNIVDLYKFRSLVQGTLLIEIETCNLVDTLGYLIDCQIGSNQLKCYMQNYQLILESTIGETVYTKQIIPDTFPLRLCISYGSSGVIYGVNDSIWILGNDSFTEIPELNILTKDINDISQTTILDLAKFPYVELKTLNSLNDSMDDVLQYLTQHLLVNREQDTAIITSPLGIQSSILGVDRLPNSLDRIGIGSDLFQNHHINAYINKLLIYDIAANKEQVRYLLNKHYTPYTPY